MRGKRRDTWANRQSWLRRQLLRIPRPLAVFTTDDSTAVEVIEACLAAELGIPDAVAILGLYRNFQRSYQTSPQAYRRVSAAS